MTFKIGDKGSATFVCKDGGTTLANASRSGIDLWLGDRIRPKWGIYRSLSDKAQLHDCYLQLRNLRGYQG
jgi:chitin-binding protein